MCAAYSTRPSLVVGIDDEWLAYQFDIAVFSWGRHVNNKLAEHDDKGKPKYDLEDILSDEDHPRNMISLTEVFLASGVERLMA